MRTGTRVEKNQKEALAPRLRERGLPDAAIEAYLDLLSATGATNYLAWEIKALALNELALKFPWLPSSPQASFLVESANFDMYFWSYAEARRCLNMAYKPQHRKKGFPDPLEPRNSVSVGFQAVRDVALLATIATMQAEGDASLDTHGCLALSGITASTDAATAQVVSSLTFYDPSVVFNEWQALLKIHASLSREVREALLASALLVQKTWGHSEAEPSEELTLELPSDRRRKDADQQAAKRERKASGFGKVAEKRFRTRKIPGGGTVVRVVPESPERDDHDEPRQPEDLQHVDLLLAPESEVTANIDAAHPNLGYRRAFIYLRNEKDWLSVPDRCDVLTIEEAERALAGIFAAGQQAARERKKEKLRACLELLLMLIGTFSVKSVLEIQLATKEQAFLAKDAVSITPHGELIRKIPSVNGRYQPKSGDVAHLHVVQGMVVLMLPMECLTLLKHWIRFQAFDISHGPLKLFPKHVGKNKTQTRLCDGLRFPTGVHRLAARPLRDVLPLEVFAKTNDLTVTQFITGSELHLSPVGGSYYTVPQSALQSVFDQAMSRLGLTPMATSKNRDKDVLIGSKLSMRDEYVRQLIGDLAYGLNRSSALIRGTVQAILDCHNRMTVYVGKMLEAALATRSAGTVGEITLRDMCLHSGLIVLADKVVDVAHSARRIVLCPLVVKQIQAFRSHLDALTTLKRLPKHVLEYANQALAGEVPLLQFVYPLKGTQKYGRKSLKKHLKRFTLPGNAFRHRAATKLREMQCPADFVAAYLEHVELGQVFGIDSPTCPLEFDQVVGSALDRWLTADGWKHVRGLGQKSLDELGDLNPGRLSRKLHTLEKSVTKQEWSRVPDRLPAWWSRRAKALPKIEEKVQSILEAHVISLQKSQGKPCLDSDFMATIRAEIIAGHSRDADHLEWTFETLHKLILEGEKHERWVCTDRRRIFRMYAEPSPFAVGMLGEHSKILFLRRWYCTAVAEHLSNCADGTAILHWLLLGLVLFDYVTDPKELEATARGVAKARRSRKLSDALLLPLDDEDRLPQVAVFSGVNAALITRLYESGHRVGDSVLTDFGKWLSRELPDQIRPTRGKVLKCLLLAARISSRFELSGTLRAIRNRSIKAVSLTPDRMAALTDHWPPKCAAVSKPEKVNEEPNFDGSRACSDAQIWDLRKELAAIVRPKTEDQKCREELEEVAANRKPLTEVEKLREFKEKVSHRSEALHLVAGYAIRLYTHGTPFKSDPAGATICKYVCQAAKYFTILGPRNGLRDWDEEDFLSFYEAIADSAKDSMEEDVRKCLWYFHSYLKDHCKMPRLDAGEVLAGHSSMANVDANIVTDTEYTAALDAFTDDIDDAERSRDFELSRYLKATLLTLILMRRSGARIGEVLGRRIVDLYLGEKCSMLFIRKSRFGTLKSLSATRAVDMHKKLTASETRILADWVYEQEKLRGSVKPRDWSLFATARGNTDPLSRSRIAALLSAKLRWSVGNPDARPHWLRHTDVCTELNALHVPARDAEGCIVPNVALATRMGGEVKGPLRLGDQVRLRAGRGHSKFMTTVASYGHVLPLTMGNGSAWSRLKFSDRSVAIIFGIGYANLRKIREHSRKHGYGEQHLTMLLLQRSTIPIAAPPAAV